MVYKTNYSINKKLLKFCQTINPAGLTKDYTSNRRDLESNIMCEHEPSLILALITSSTHSNNAKRLWGQCSKMRVSRPTGMERNEARKSKISNICTSSISAKIYSTHNLFSHAHYSCIHESSTILPNLKINVYSHTRSTEIHIHVRDSAAQPFTPCIL